MMSSNGNRLVFDGKTDEIGTLADRLRQTGISVPGYRRDRDDGSGGRDRSRGGRSVRDRSRSRDHHAGGRGSSRSRGDGNRDRNHDRNPGSRSRDRDREADIDISSGDDSRKIREIELTHCNLTCGENEKVFADFIKEVSTSTLER